MVELTSPDSKCTIMCHPSKVDEMKASGWTTAKPKTKKEVKLNG